MNTSTVTHNHQTQPKTIKTEQILDTVDDEIFVKIEDKKVEGEGSSDDKKESRFVKLDTREIDKIADSRTAQSTTRKTMWAVKVFKGKCERSDEMICISNCLTKC